MDIEVFGAQLSATEESVGNTGSAVPTKATLVGGTDGTNLRGLSVDSSGHPQVDILTSALPTGAATETTLAEIADDTTGTGSLGALNDAVTISCNGKSHVAFQLSGTFSAVMTAEATSDGTNWVAQTIIVYSTNSFTGTSVNAVGIYGVNCSGFNQFRIRCSTYVSGSVNCTIRAGLGAKTQWVYAAQSGSWSTRLLDSASSAITGRTVGSARALDIAIMNGSGTQFSDFATETTVNAIKTAVELIDNAISGTEMQVDVVASLPAGTNTVGAVLPAPQSGSTNALSSAATTALAASLVVKASAGRLMQLTGVNTAASAQYIQVHNTSSLPADTAVPVLLAYVPAGGNFSFDFAPYGCYFATGITVCNSSTAATKTIGSADCWFNAEYI